MPSKSKTKGNTFEREVAKLLTETFDQPFQRTPNSGAYTGGKNASRKEFLDEGQIKGFRGDIIPPDDFEVCIECKNYASFPFHQLLEMKHIQQLQEWIHEVEFDANGMFWLLIFKITRKGTYVCWDRQKYQSLFGAPVFYQRYGLCEIGKFLANNRSNLLKYMKK